MHTFKQMGPFIYMIFYTLSPKHFRAISYSHLAEARSGEAVESIAYDPE